MSKHTPGPWYATRDHYGRMAVNNHTEFPSEFPVAAIFGPLTDTVANARLIAAAPELLAFIERITDATGPYTDLNGHQIVADAYAVIAKATGAES